MSDLPPEAITTAMRLVGAVRDRGPEDVAALLCGADLRAVAVTLAAMVPEDQTARELLAWNDEAAGRARRWNRRATERKHGTHSAYNQHLRWDEVPCEACTVAERDYRREQKRRQRHAHPTEHTFGGTGGILGSSEPRAVGADTGALTDTPDHAGGRLMPILSHEPLTDAGHPAAGAA